MCISYKTGAASALAIVKVVQCFILFLCPFLPFHREGKQEKQTEKCLPELLSVIETCVRVR